MAHGSAQARRQSSASVTAFRLTASARQYIDTAPAPPNGIGSTREQFYDSLQWLYGWRAEDCLKGAL
ncbi:hypothetical protein [Paraburkholderia dinghuensis]|uniref:Uncharacterized protein n=1 Tax=Paraburkholderia dinghuensis TaxID=2305225 RepID=A0A3N6NDF0_9BURK|nr:hypothetical protein [Paraburkholderia dinghuensis]RQH07012.1 hypothetical protein D1Y85_10050 [Paraburkholderia dinghuensis]